jgi:HD-GYP domain-containing protein (c-di-GMP phosphodiesterase class II)
MLAYTFERWDGGGLPAGARRDAIPVEMRIVHLSDVAEVHLRLGGVDGAVEMAKARSGTHFDPAVVTAFASHSDKILGDLPTDNVWRAALELAPDRDRLISGAELERLLEAVGAFADLKSPYMIGHSGAVASLAERAGACYGLADEAVRQLRLAALVHDLGRMAVPNSIWEKAGPLSDGEWERVRLYPYLSGRILSRVSGLAGVAAIASAHQERVDGTGYPKGLTGTMLTPEQRILAAADVYQALREPRPHRPELTAGEAADQLRQAARQSKLDSKAVAAVLEAAGHPVPRRTTFPAGLTAREVEILVLIARGRPVRTIATALNISPKTVRNHVEHIYAKLEVGNRTGAALFAVRHGLVG